MDREELFAWIAEYFGAEPEYPWEDTNAVLRHREDRKWFAAVLSVSAEKLGLTGDTAVDVVNVKCEPILIGSLLLQNGYHRAYHMNKEKWISIRLDGSVPPEQIRTLVSISYDMTGIKPKRKTKERSDSNGI